MNICILIINLLALVYKMLNILQFTFYKFEILEIPRNDSFQLMRQHLYVVMLNFHYKYRNVNIPFHFLQINEILILIYFFYLEVHINNPLELKEINKCLLISLFVNVKK